MKDEKGNNILIKIIKLLSFFNFNFLKFEKIGFTKLIESGYDEYNDIYFLVMNKLDEDLNTVLKRTSNESLAL